VSAFGFAGIETSEKFLMEDCIMLNHIDRGYERSEEKLRAIGARIERLTQHDKS
jgi:UDP-N-acetylglucosamine enolpyruvyl transferase